MRLENFQRVSGESSYHRSARFQLLAIGRNRTNTTFFVMPVHTYETIIQNGSRRFISTNGAVTSGELYQGGFGITTKSRTEVPKM
uniref:Uncharacterized protein n=1 Tax=Romanomermis culicivorax TaxID=13658 RepID=A0A915J689_ROMCU